MNKLSIKHLFCMAFILTIIASACDPDAYEWDSVDTNAIDERYNTLTGPATVFGSDECSYPFSMILRGTSTYTWSVSGATATITSVSADRGDYAVEISFAPVAAATEIVITAVENTGFGKSYEFTSTVELRPFEGPVAGSLAGKYEATTNYGQHDFLPDYASATIISTITEVSSNVYSIDDASGGLYSVGPYVDAYGTSGIAFEFTHDPATNAITWMDQSDPWGSFDPTPDGVNTYDPETQTLTISWTCAGYGESGVTVYAP